MIEALKAQLASLRTQIGSFQAQVIACEEIVALLEPVPPAPCDHRSTTNIGTFGAPVYQCDTCRQIVPEVG